MPTVEAANGNDDDHGNSGGGNTKPELQAIAAALEHIALELKNGFAVLAEAWPPPVATPIE